MPLYQYQCKKCEQIFEKRLSMTDRKVPETENCPSCDAQNTVLQYMGASPVIHSGEGLGSMKPNSDFLQLLDNIHKKNNRSVNNP